MPTPADAAATAAALPILNPDHVWYSVKEFAERYPGVSLGGCRWAIFNSSTNGLDKAGAVVRRGRRVLINPERWFAWQRTNPVCSPPRARTRTKAAPASRIARPTMAGCA
ncbi:hypothetical protein [uncultured Thiodictyon sp.]|jgi:hypothetical protein|uniref:hypothetical protein n=1 Tax=uncultured Thiodictyon sp. TaxID=1846217 RepID=UPI0025DAE3E0|nr:hypothetical protein [uncultured Thiodictyon sp.]